MSGWVTRRFGGRDVEIRVHHGAGPAVLLMSGAAQPGEYWRPVVEQLGDRLVISYDRPGMGATPWPGHLPSLAEEVAAAAGLAGEWGPPVVVGHSMAAFHAEALVREHPGAVRGLVLVDPSVEWPTAPPTPVGAGGGAHRRQGRRVRAVGAGPGRCRGGDAKPDQLVAAEDPQVLQRRAAAPDLRAARFAGHGDRRADGLSAAGLGPHGGAAPSPVAGDAGHRAVGREIRARRRTGAERLARMLGAQLWMAPRSRHLMMLDDPGIIARAVRQLG